MAGAPQDARSEPTIRLTLVAAIGRNRVIGDGRGLLWHLQSDLIHFRKLTMGKPLIMGRKTFQSIGRPLPGRPTFVMSRQPIPLPPGLTWVADLSEALERAVGLARELRVDEVMIVGGGAIYAQTIAGADRLCITEVDLSPLGETVFPAIDPDLWQEVWRERHSKSIGDDADYCFVEYYRRRSQSALKSRWAAICDDVAGARHCD
jgi:dihydrofolate reductase